MDKSYGITHMSSRRFYSFPLKSLRNNKLLSREFQNITTIKVHRVNQELKTGNRSTSPHDQVLPQKVHRLFTTQENSAPNFRQKTTMYYSKEVRETERYKGPRFLRPLLFSITFSRISLKALYTPFFFFLSLIFHCIPRQTRF